MSPTVTLSAQRLRNLTTGRLHTEMGHVYLDLGMLVGVTGVLTHMLPRVLWAVEPWLREHVLDPRYWDGNYDTTHAGDLALPAPSTEDRQAMLSRYLEMSDPLAELDRHDTKV